MLPAITETARILMGVLGVGALVLGFAATAALAVFVLRKAPKDGTDIGRDPRLSGDDQPRSDGHQKSADAPLT